MGPLFFLSAILGVFLLSSGVEAGKIKDPGSDFFYAYDPPSRVLSLTQRVTNPTTGVEEENTFKLEGITASWSHDDVNLTSNVTFALPKVGAFTKALFSLPYTLVEEDKDFRSTGVMVDGFEQKIRFGRYKRPDDSECLQIQERYFEKKECTVQEKMVPRCVKTREIISQGVLKKEHWMQDIRILETTEVVLRKDTAESTAYEFFKTASSAEKVLGTPTYYASTTAGEPCPAGGCTGPNEKEWIQNTINNVLGQAQRTFKKLL